MMKNSMSHRVNRGEKPMKLTVEKVKLTDVIQKGLGIKGTKKLLDNVLVRFKKDGVIFGELIGIALGVAAAFKTSYFSDYKVSKTSDVVFDPEHLTRLGFLRDSSIKLLMTESLLLMSTGSGKEDFPIALVEKKYTDEDLRVEGYGKGDEEVYGVHDVVKPINIEMSNSTEAFVDLETTYERSLLTSDDEDYDDEEFGYYPIYAYLILERSELGNLPDSDSIILRKKMVTERGTKAVPAIELQTVQKMDIGSGGYTRILAVEMVKWQDPANFEVRVDRSSYDCATAHLGSRVKLVITRDYIFLSDVNDQYWLGYLIGLVQEGTEETEEEEKPEEETKEVEIEE